MTSFTMLGIMVHLVFVLLSQLGQVNGDCQVKESSIEVKMTEPNSWTCTVSLPVCFGTCQTSSYSRSSNGKSEMEHELSCCMPTKYKTVNVTFLGFDGTLPWKLYKAIEECGCYSCTHIPKG